MNKDHTKWKSKQLKACLLYHQQNLRNAMFVNNENITAIEKLFKYNKTINRFNNILNIYSLQNLSLSSIVNPTEAKGYFHYCYDFN